MSCEVLEKKNPYCLECRANGPKLREPLWETYGELCRLTLDQEL